MRERERNGNPWDTGNELLSDKSRQMSHISFLFFFLFRETDCKVLPALQFKTQSPSMNVSLFVSLPFAVRESFLKKQIWLRFQGKSWTNRKRLHRLITLKLMSSVFLRLTKKSLCIFTFVALLFSDAEKSYLTIHSNRILYYILCLLFYSFFFHFGSSQREALNALSLQPNFVSLPLHLTSSFPCSFNHFFFKMMFQ